MALLEKLLIKIGVDLAEFERKMKTMASRMDAVGQKMSAMGRKMTTMVTLPIIGAATAAIKFASDMEEALNKVDVSFGQSAQSIKDWAETTLDAFGIAEGTALDMAAGFGDMATSMGITRQEAAEMSISLVGLAGDLASFKNISIDVANTALTAIFTGETESLKKLGIVMTQANLDAFAMANGFDGTTKSMTESEKVLLRYAFVMDKTGNAQGDFAATSDSTANSLRVMMESLKEAAAALGEVLLPIITPIIKKISDFIKKIADMDERQRKIIVTIALLAAAIGPLLLIIGALASSFNALVLAAPAIVAAFTAIGSAMTFMLGPVGLVILAVVALIVIGIALVKNWDAISAAAKESWGIIKDTVSNAMTRLKDNLAGTWENIKQAAISSFNGMKNAITTKMTEIKMSISQKLNDIKTFFSELPQRAKDWGKNMIQGFIDGIMEKIQAVKDAVSKITSAASEFLGFGSPTEKGEGRHIVKWGENMISGFLDGVQNMIPDVGSVIGNVTGQAAVSTQSMQAAGDTRTSSSMINIYPQNLNDAQVDYLFNKFNARLGVSG